MVFSRKRKRTNRTTSQYPRKRFRVRKRYGRRYRRRRYPRRRYGRNRRLNKTAVSQPAVSVYLNPFKPPPRQAYVKMHYVGLAYLDMADTAGARTWASYYGNSIVDTRSDDGVTARSVTGFTLLTPFYNKYTVLAAKIRATFTTAADIGCQAFVLATRDTSPPVWTLGTFSQDNRIKTKYLAMRYGPGGRPTRINDYHKTTSVSGVTDIEDPSYAGNYGDTFASSTAPSNKWYYHVGVMALPGTTVSSNLRVWARVHITYYVKLHEYVETNLDIKT